MDKVKVCVIGVGFWGRNHARVFSEINRAELVAICDINLERASTIAKRYNAQWYIDYEEMLKKEKPDAVTICTPTVTHAEIALNAMKYNVNLLIEKPLASNTKEALKIIERARERNLKVMVGFIERFNPGVERVRRLIMSEKIGKLVLISTRRVSRWPQRIGDVGVIKDLAIHDIDIVRYLTNDEPLEVYAIAGSLRHTYEDYANIVMKLGNGVVAFIEANWLTPRKIRSLTITGSEGVITLDYITQEITIENSEYLIKPSVKWEEPLKRELMHFVEAISEDKNFKVTAIDGYKALLIAEASLASATTGKPVKVKYKEGVANDSNG